MAWRWLRARLIDATVAEHVANESNLLSALSRTERRQLASLLRKLLLGLPPERASSPSSHPPDGAGDRLGAGA